jgi:hypothetical protein
MFRPSTPFLVQQEDVEPATEASKATPLVERLYAGLTTERHCESQGDEAIKAPQKTTRLAINESTIAFQSRQAKT